MFSDTDTGKIGFNKKRRNIPVAWKAIIAVSLVLFLSYSSEYILWNYIIPERSKTDLIPDSLEMFRGFSFYFVSHITVAGIVIFIFEIPRKRIKLQWLFFILLLLICYPMSLGVYALNLLFREFIGLGFETYKSILKGLANLPEVITSMLVYSLIIFWDNSRRQQEQVHKAETLMSEARWQMLRYQVNPHFLFNSLNSIMALIKSDADLARSVVNELSDYFRYTLSLNSVNKVVLSQELLAAKNYMAIQKIRFKERLDYTINSGRGTEDLLVPVFGVQTLVENAVKYGLKTCKGTVKVNVNAFKVDNYYYIRVVNSGSLYKHGAKDTHPEVEGTNSGIENLVERLSLLYPGSSWFDLREDDNTVVAEIKINI